MKSTTRPTWHFVLFLLLPLLELWAARPALAQAPPLREVTRLARVAEPPGGLIPYRAGQLWGYADTTGRVVIRPCLDARQGAPAVFFTQGFALTKQYAIADCLPAPSEEPYRLVVLNARGEVLRVRGWQAAVAQPDGSLRLVPRWQAYGQWELAQLDSAAHSGFSDSGYCRVVPGRLDEPEPGPGDSVGYQPRLLGAHRGTRANEYTGARMPRERSPDHSGRWLGLYALTDRQGHLLTSYQFVSVDSFYEGRARVVLPEWHLTLTRAQRRVHYADENPASTAPAYGYIDTTGALIASGFGSVFRHGRAVVAPTYADGSGIIDPLGRYQLPLQPYALSEPDEAGFVRLYGPAHGPNSIHYLAPPGQPGFAAQAFARAGPFVQGRARARQGARAGLLDVAGRWVTRRAYEVLLSPASLGPGRFRAFSEEDADYRDYDLEFAPPTSRPHLPAAPPYRETTAQDLYESWPDFLAPRFPAADPAYLVARRRGKYGLVARRSGRETVRARYDSVRFNPCRGLVCLWRAGQPYVVEAATGRALAGAYGGIDFLTPRGERLPYLTRSAPAAWALLDTLGHLRTPWIPGTGYPTPQGWLLSHEPQGYTLRDSTGRLAYSAPGPICQPQWSQLWADVKKVYDEQEPATKRPYWQLPLALHNPAVRGAFVVTDSLTHTLRLLDAHLRELGQVPAAGTSPLAGGGLARLAPTGTELYTDAGQRLPAPPPGTTWLGPGYLYHFNYARAWRAHGVLPTAQGYVTRGGRKLWE